MTKYPAVVCACISLMSVAANPQALRIKDAKVAVNKSATDRQVVLDDAELLLDDQARKLVVKNQDHPLELAYDDVQKVVFDASTRMRGGKLGKAIGGLSGALISAKHVTDSWCFIQYKSPEGTANSYVLTIPGESVPSLRDKMRALFNEKVVVAEFSEKAQEIEKKTLKDIASKQDLKVDKQNRPMPELTSDKALVVVVCPKVPSEESTQIKLHANDRVVWVNRTGTYGFVNLDPGEYVLASQGEDASAIRMTLEPGKDYYFLQDPFMGGAKTRTTLTRHSKELVMFLVDASYYADWKPK